MEKSAPSNKKPVQIALTTGVTGGIILFVLNAIPHQSSVHVPLFLFSLTLVIVASITLNKFLVRYTLPYTIRAGMGLIAYCIAIVVFTIAQVERAPAAYNSTFHEYLNAALGMLTVGTIISLVAAVFIKTKQA